MGQETGTDLKVLLDTFPLVKFFKDEPGAKQVEEILNKIERGDIKGSIASVTVAELLYIFARFRNIDLARAIITHIGISKIKTISLDNKIAELAGEFKFRYTRKDKRGLPIADAFIAAASAAKNAILITEEKHYFKIKGITVKTPSQFLSEL